MEKVKDNRSNEDEKLTIEQLRSFPGCENYTDEEAKEIVESICQIAILLFDIADWKKSQELIANNNPVDISLFDDNNNLNKAA